MCRLPWVRCRSTWLRMPLPSKFLRLADGYRFRLPGLYGRATLLWKAEGSEGGTDRQNVRRHLRRCLRFRDRRSGSLFADLLLCLHMICPLKMGSISKEMSLGVYCAIVGKASVTVTPAPQAPPAVPATLGNEKILPH